MIASIKQWLQHFLHPVDWELERYLAGAADCADLEHRMQDWARRNNKRG